MKEKISILYVDDEETLRMLVSHQLEPEGFAVDSADDGDTAVEMTSKKNYAVILLDVRMPRMNGIEVLKYLREHKSPSRIIMLTGVDDLAVALEAVKNGANDYITKPYDLSNLVKCIRRVIEK